MTNLLVTPEDEKRADDWATMIGRMGGVFLDQSQRRGLASQFAAHRISHSLPGDVGMRLALTDIRAEASAREPLPLPSGTKETHRCVATALAGRLGSIERKARAALTPSALSGDAG